MAAALALGLLSAACASEAGSLAEADAPAIEIPSPPPIRTPSPDPEPTPSTPRPEPSPTAIPWCRARDVSVRLNLDKASYALGEPVRMSMVVENVSGQRCEMGYSDSRTSDFFVYRKGRPRGDSVWSEWHCDAALLLATSETWEVAHREVRRVRWSQEANPEGCVDPESFEPLPGEQVEPGDYVAVGEFRGPGVRSGPVAFRIV